MTVFDAIQAIRLVGEVRVDEAGVIRGRVPQGRSAEIRSAIEVIRLRRDAALLALSNDKEDAARAFVQRAGARLACARCYPDLPRGVRYAILVPEVNDDGEFREAVRILGMDGLPIIPRAEPIELPRCSLMR